MAETREKYIVRFSQKNEILVNLLESIAKVNKDPNKTGKSFTNDMRIKVLLNKMNPINLENQIGSANIGNGQENGLSKIDEAINTISQVPPTTLDLFVQLAKRGQDYEIDDENLAIALQNIGFFVDAEKQQEMGNPIVGGFTNAPATGMQEQDNINAIDPNRDATFLSAEAALPFAPNEQTSHKDKEELNIFLDGTTDPEEVETKTKTFYAKRYYLTGPIMAKKLKETLFFEKLDGETQRILLEAYEYCVDPNRLLDPNFLDDYMANIAHISGKGRFKLDGIHMAVLGNTYVGYQMEEVGVESSEPNEKQQETIAVLKNPNFTKDMPASLAERTLKEGKAFIENRLRDVINGNNTYTALAIISPLREFVAGSLDKYEQSLGEGEEQTMMKVFLKKAEGDISEQAKNGLNNFNVQFNMTGVDWTNAEARRDVIRSIRALSREAGELGVEEAIKSVSLTYVVRDSSDIQRLQALQNDFSAIKPDFDLRVAFDAPPQEAAELRAELASAGVDARVDVSTQTEIEAARVASAMIGGAITGTMEGEVATGLAAGTLGLVGGVAVNAALATFATQTIANLGEFGVGLEDSNTLGLIINASQANGQSVDETGAITAEGKLRVAAAIGYAGNMGTKTKDEMIKALGLEGAQNMEEVEQELFEAMMDITDEFGIPDKERDNQ